jgi:hypothetical protein
MKSLQLIIVAALCSASTAFAATGAREDNSGIFVWIFLGMCALIVVAQIMPALLILTGLVKGMERKKETATETVSAK